MKGSDNSARIDLLLEWDKWCQNSFKTKKGLHMGCSREKQHWKKIDYKDKEIEEIGKDRELDRYTSDKVFLGMVEEVKCMKII